MPDPDKAFTRADPFSKTRCQSIGGGGQCPFEAVNGTQYCPRHQGSNKGDRESRRKYTSAKWMEKIGYQSTNPEIKELNEEIGILRMLVSSKLDACQDETELLMHSQQLTNLVREIGVLNEKWHKIQMQTNAVMDRTQALDFVQSIGEIIGEHIKHYPDSSDILTKISNAMIDDLNRRTGPSLRTV